MYGSTRDNGKIKKSRKQLDDLYVSIPSTKGCLENINKENGCGAWCCFLQSPQVLYVEFLNTWNYILNNWEDNYVIELLGFCIERYVFSKEINGCVFWNKESRMCSQHETRPYNCFLPNTWIFTECGPKKISNIISGDRIIGHDGRLHLVLATNTHLYGGKIYGIRPQGNHVFSYSTFDHKWLVSRQKDKRKNPKPIWVESNSLVSKSGNKTGDYLIFPKNDIKHNDNIIYIDTLSFVKGEEYKDRILPFTSGKLFSQKKLQSIPARIEINDDFLFTIGIYLAEGYSSTSSCSFCMNINEKKYLSRIEKYLTSLGIKTHYNIRKNNMILRIDSCMFGRLMSSLCGKLACNKKISSKLIKNLTFEQKLKIFESWAIGDGRKPNDTISASVSTISEELAIQMQQILLENNIYPRIQKYHNKNRGFDSYSVIVNRSSLQGWSPKEGQGSKIMYDAKNIYSPLAEIDILDYQGPVVDLQVEGIESFVTSSGAVHNCRIYGIIPDEEFKPRYERLKVIYPETRYQCDLVSTENGKKVTTKDTDKWWNTLKSIEMRIGISVDDIHDGFGGSYRHYHEHILIHVFGEDVMENLSQLRISDEDNMIKKQVINKIIEKISSTVAELAGNEKKKV